VSKSIDYAVFLDDFIAEFKRLKKVYTAEQADDTLNVVAAGDVTHLRYLGITKVPAFLKPFYGNAYDHMRGVYRALQVIQYNREDFYNHAAADMDKQAALYSEKQQIMVKNLELFEKYMDPDVAERLSKAHTLASATKEKLILEIREKLGVPEDEPISNAIMSYYFGDLYGEKE
jgi:hypothetical protein